MKILGKTFFEKETPQPITHVVKSDTSGFNFTTFGLGYNSDCATEYVQKTAKGYLFGADGLYPQELNNLVNKSPMHSSILRYKKLLTVSNGYVIINEPSDVNSKISLNQFTNQVDKILNDLGMDYFTHSNVYLKITWGNDFKKIIKIDRISPTRCRINEINNEQEPISYIYNWDWTNSKYPSTIYPAFNPANKTDKVQIYQFQVTSPGMKLYAEPTYQSCITAIHLNAEILDFYKYSMHNSLNPSLLIQYFEKPSTKEKQQEILAAVNNSLAGTKKNSRAFITYSDGKDLAPHIEQLEPAQMSKAFTKDLIDTIEREICTGHLINPSLMGIRTVGSLGDSDLATSYEVFNQAVIQPAQKDIEFIFNDLLSYNGLGVKIKLQEPTLTFK